MEVRFILHYNYNQVKVNLKTRSHTHTPAHLHSRMVSWVRKKSTMSQFGSREIAHDCLTGACYVGKPPVLRLCGNSWKSVPQGMEEGSVVRVCNVSSVASTLSWMKILPCPVAIIRAAWPEVTRPQAHEQRGSNLGEGPRLPEQWVFSQHEEAWKTLTYPAASPAQPCPAPQEESASGLCLWFASSPSLPWPSGGQEIETLLLGMAAGLDVLVSALCRGLGRQHTQTACWGETESGGDLLFLSICCRPKSQGKKGGGWVLNLHPGDFWLCFHRAGDLTRLN